MFHQNVSIHLDKTHTERALLVVDDNGYVADATMRLFATRFDKVFMATGPNEATQILEENIISHILCGLSLGEDAERLPGIMFSSFWRSEFSSIERIVVFSTEDITDQTIPYDVDAIISETTSPDGIAKALLL